MKKQQLLLSYLTIIFTVFTIKGFSQQGSGTFNYHAELKRMITVPNSPEAQAFAKYGNVAVNLNVGAPNVSIPLYTYKGREMNLPISLTYDISARKVDNIASNVGMG